MAWCQGLGSQILLILLMQRGLLVHEDEQVVGQGFVDLDNLMLCKVRAPNIGKELTLFPIPVPHTVMLLSPCAVPPWPGLHRRPPPWSHGC